MESSEIKLQFEKYEEEYIKNRADVAKERGGIASDDHQEDEGPCVRYGFVVSQVCITHVCYRMLLVCITHVCYRCSDYGYRTRRCFEE